MHCSRLQNPNPALLPAREALQNKHIEDVSQQHEWNCTQQHEACLKAGPAECACACGFPVAYIDLQIQTWMPNTIWVRRTIQFSLVNVTHENIPSPLVCLAVETLPLRDKQLAQRRALEYV